MTEEKNYTVDEVDKLARKITQAGGAAELGELGGDLQEALLYGVWPILPKGEQEFVNGVAQKLEGILANR